MTIFPPEGQRKVGMYYATFFTFTLLLVLGYLSGDQYMVGVGAIVTLATGGLVAERYANRAPRMPYGGDPYA